MNSESEKASTAKQQLVRLQQDYATALPEKLKSIENLWSQLYGRSWDAEIQRVLQQQCHTLIGSGTTFGLPQVSERARIVDDLISCINQQQIPTQQQIQGIHQAITNLLALSIELVKTTTAVRNALPKATPLAQRPVYIVEDDLQLAQQMKLFLEQRGYDVAICSDWAGIKLLIEQQLPGAFLIDMALGDNLHGGADIVHHIREQLMIDLPVLFITAHDDFATRLKAARAGGDVFVAKPVNMDELVEKLDNIVAKASLSPYKIMVVDDDALLAEHYKQVLLNAGFESVIETNPLNVIASLVDFEPELLLLDLYMPQCTGLELAKVLRQYEAYANIPLVFLTAETTEEMSFTARKIGVDDYLTKPITDAHLISAVLNRVQKARRVNSLIFRDSMSGLLTHNKLEEELIRQISIVKRTNRPLCFCMLDLDKFKRINDEYGHLAGDAVIKSFANMLKIRLRRSDIIGRYGGEEFGVIFPDTTVEEAMVVTDVLREEYSIVEHVFAGAVFSVTVSGGITQCQKDDNCESLIARADQVLYHAKSNGRNQIVSSPKKSG